MKIHLLFIWIIFNQITLAQNLILNPSFEEYDSLPQRDGSFVGFVKNWDNLNGKSRFPYGTPDYKHRLGGQEARLPNTYHGSLEAQDSAAVVGLLTLAGWADNYREYISTRLKTPLTKGQRYELSFYVSLAWQNPYCAGATNNLGCLLSVEKPIQKMGEVISQTPHWQAQEVLKPFTWQKISFQFTAQTEYAYLTLGNFQSDKQTQYARVFKENSTGAYYFLDNFSLTQVPDSQMIMNQRLPNASNLQVNGRKVEKQATFKIRAGKLQISIFDYGKQDGDSISLNFNGEWVLRNYMATKKPKILNLIPQKGTNLLVLYAHNLGKIPPNTAVVEFKDKYYIRQRLTVKSDFSHSGAIEFQMTDY
ncbi:MAG: hypothetical protein MUE85_16965 [Microscillaceae bacterium]|jgi:hypothetical protein|nr:hypothetical protein [Microscillaceae bacterium]